MCNCISQVFIRQQVFLDTVTLKDMTENAGCPSRKMEVEQKDVTNDETNTGNKEESQPKQSENTNCDEVNDKDSGFAVPTVPTSKIAKLEKKQISSEKSTLEPRLEYSDTNAAVSIKKKDKMFPLIEPSWGGIPDDDIATPYSLTVLKDGILISNIQLSGKSRLTFGRFDDCDVVTEHPSCSRYHAVLQYCVEEKGIRTKGFYLYDMGSTHGTYLNKQKIQPKIYNRVRVGYQLKFGGSSRLYIVEVR